MISLRQQTRQPSRARSERASAGRGFVLLSPARSFSAVRAALPWVLTAAWCALAVAGAARLHSLEARAAAAESAADQLAREQAGYDKWLREQEAILSDFQRQLDRVPKPVLPPVGDWSGVMRP